MDWLSEIAASWDADDDIFSNVVDVTNSIFGGGGDSKDSTVWEAAMSGGAPEDATGGAGKLAQAAAKESSGWSIGKALEKAWDGIKWEDPKVQSAAMTVGAGIVSGLGAGYLANKKREQEMQIAKDRLDVERLLAQSQTNIANQKMANQNFSGMQFQQPAGGLVYSPSIVEPVSQWRRA